MFISSFRSGNFEISIYNSLTTELSEKWDEMNPESLNSSYLRLIEDSRPRDLDFRYVIVEEIKNEQKEICAIIYFQLIKFTCKNIHFSNSLFLSFAAFLILTLRPFRIMICGNLFAVNFPAINFNSHKLTYEKILDIISEIESLEKPDVIMLKDLDEDFSVPRMTTYGWMKYSTDLTMALNIDPDWKTMEDYIRCLSKKYKSRANKIIASGKTMNRREMNAEEIKKNAKAINILFNQVALKQTVNMGLIDADYFYEFKRRFAGIFSFVGYLYNDNLVGFSTYIDHGRVLEMHYIGIDYNFNKETKIYFNILFDGVERAIRNNKEQLELGRTAREAKANLGGTPVFFNDYIKIKGRLASALSKRFSKYFQAELGDEWTGRHPFG